MDMIHGPRFITVRFRRGPPLDLLAEGGCGQFPLPDQQTLMIFLFRLSLNADASLLIADVELAEAHKTTLVETAANDFVKYLRIFERGYIYPTRRLFATSGLGSPKFWDREVTQSAAPFRW